MMEMAPDILGELLDGGVTAVRLFAQRHQNNVVEVAAQTLAELFGGPFSGHTESRIDRLLPLAVAGWQLLPPHCRARLFRLRFADRAGNLVRRASRDMVRRASGEQFI